MDDFLALLGDEINDAAEETALLFMNIPALQDLGMVDPKAECVELTIAGRDLIIKQSPGALQSRRDSGTTGAVVWQTSVRFAEWLATPDNILFKSNLLGQLGIVLELGSGISALVPLMLAPRVPTIVATDQAYVLKLLGENYNANGTIKPPRGSKARHIHTPLPDIRSLDWEHDDPASLLRSRGSYGGVDAIMACDCIYNYALIEPFVQTCVDVCKVRRAHLHDHASAACRFDCKPTVCIVANHLRQPDVFEQWLEAFMRSFRVWRVPDDSLTARLREGSGFAVHVGVMR